MEMVQSDFLKGIPTEYLEQAKMMLMENSTETDIISAIMELQQKEEVENHKELVEFILKGNF